MSPDSDLQRPDGVAGTGQQSPRRSNGGESTAQTGQPDPRSRTATAGSQPASWVPEGDGSEAAEAIDRAREQNSQTRSGAMAWVPRSRGPGTATVGSGSSSPAPASTGDGSPAGGLGLSADDRGGPGSWIDAPPGMQRSGEAISMADRRLARALGWFSFGLGIPQLLIPGRICRVAGLENTFFKRQVVRLVGLREIGAGAGIFSSQPKPAEWLWARVAGDAMDLLMLRAAFGNPASRRGRLMLATAGVAGVTALDVVEAKKHQKALKESGEELSLKGRASVTVNRPAEEVYRQWRDLENLPKFMYHLESVKPTGDNRYHWVANAPLGRQVEWDAEIFEEVPGQLIAWRSTEDSDVPNSGSVRFVPAPGGRGTEVIVEVDYQLPGGAIGDTVARMFGDEPQQQIKDDLRRFKQVVETGEVVRSEGVPEGTYAGSQVKWRPAQPLP